MVATISCVTNHPTLKQPLTITHIYISLWTSELHGSSAWSQAFLVQPGFGCCNLALAEWLLCTRLGLAFVSDVRLAWMIYNGHSWASETGSMSLTLETVERYKKRRNV